MGAQPPRDVQRMLEQAYGLDRTSTPAQRPKRVEPRRYRPIARPSQAQPMPDADGPHLRLVGVEPDPPASRPAPAVQPLKGATDPRWVLAVRTSEQLEGTILTPEARHRLMRLGRLLGLSPFDCSLVIAIVQDQARRGYPPAECPAAGQAQLQMVALRPAGALLASLRRINVWQLVAILGAAIVAELIILRLIFG